MPSNDTNSLSLDVSEQRLHLLISVDQVKLTIQDTLFSIIKGIFILFPK